MLSSSDGSNIGSLQSHGCIDQVLRVGFMIMRRGLNIGMTGNVLDSTNAHTTVAYHGYTRLAIAVSTIGGWIIIFTHFGKSDSNSIELIGTNDTRLERTGQPGTILAILDLPLLDLLFVGLIPKELSLIHI